MRFLASAFRLFIIPLQVFFIKDRMQFFSNQ